MTGAEIHAARARLGEMWGLGRPLLASELGRVLRLTGRDPGEAVRDWEIGKASVSGPVSVAIDLMLAGARPEGWSAALKGAVA